MLENVANSLENFKMLEILTVIYTTCLQFLRHHSSAPKGFASALSSKGLFGGRSCASKLGPDAPEVGSDIGSCLGVPLLALLRTAFTAFSQIYIKTYFLF